MTHLIKMASVLVLAMCSIARLLAAQDYPARPIHVIAPNTPGGATDVASRLIGPALSELLGQPVVVENRVGAGGVIATNAVAKAAPDGYTLIMVFDSFATNPYLYSNVQYDPIRDFAPVSMVARSPQLLVAHPDLGVRTFADFLQLARSRGSNLDFATAGAGSSSRLSLELLKLSAGIDPTAIHFKGGGEAVKELLGGRVQVMLVTLGVVNQQVKAGRLIPIAATSRQRISSFPDVPAISEFFPAFEVHSWLGLLAPAATPKAIVGRLNAGIVNVLAQPGVRQKFEVLGFDVAPGAAETFGELIREETAKWKRVIRERRITLD